MTDQSASADNIAKRIEVFKPRCVLFFAPDEFPKWITSFGWKRAILIAFAGVAIFQFGEKVIAPIFEVIGNWLAAKVLLALWL